MKLLSFLAFTIVLAFNISAQNIRISADDLKPLEGEQWVGNLTYIDYTSKKKTSIKSNITITRSKTDKLTWTFEMQYPLEPEANSKNYVKFSSDGMTFDGERVVERTKLPKDVLRIVTTKRGKDDGSEATFRRTYLISKSAFSIRKEVKVDGADAFFERNIYTWKR